MQSASFTFMILSDVQDTYFCRVLTQKAIISLYKLKVHSSLSTLSWNNFQITDDQSKLGKQARPSLQSHAPGIKCVGDEFNEWIEGESAYVDVDSWESHTLITYASLPPRVNFVYSFMICTTYIDINFKKLL